MFKSRKFVVFAGVMGFVWAAVMSAIFVAPQVINPTVLITAISASVLVGMAYIGGNVWDAYIKSKWFRPELLDHK